MPSDPIANAIEGSRLAHALPLIDAELRKREEAILRGALQRLEAGELTPELALSALMQVNEVRRLSRSLDKSAKLALTGADDTPTELRTL